MKTDLTVTSPDTVAGYTHRFVPRSGPDPRTLLLLHGTGGDENDLLSLGKSLDPQAALLSPRGTVLENGANRFFRRVAEGVFDLEDLRARTDDLARFVREATTQYELDPTNVIAVGFSNGANIAASVLLAHPGTFAGAILFRAMVPFEPDPVPRLEGRAILMAEGRFDPMIPVPQAERLAALFRESGAEVDVEWQEAGHQLTPKDIRAAESWLARRGLRQAPG
jgi:predicted esterase